MKLVKISFVLAIFLPFHLFAESTRAIMDNNKGVDHMSSALDLLKLKHKEMQQKKQEMMQKGEKPNEEDFKAEIDAELLDQAKNKLVEAVIEEPFSAVIHNNLGIVYELSKDPLNALKEYKAAIEYSKEHSVTRFEGYYNTARVYAQLQSIDKALEYYQKALDISPDSPEVRVNIEFLWQGGQGKGKGDKQEKDKGDKGKGKGENDKGKDKNKKPDKVIGGRKTKKFKSGELTKDDVRKILEEIKNQEKEIRNKQFQKSIKEPPRGKDW